MCCLVSGLLSEYVAQCACCLVSGLVSACVAKRERRLWSGALCVSFSQ